MKVDGKPMRTIWLEPDGWSVGVIDQTALPHRLVTARLTTLSDAAHAIRHMVIRGALLPLPDGGFDLLVRDYAEADWRTLLTISADDAPASGVLSFTGDGKSLLAIS